MTQTDVAAPAFSPAPSPGPTRARRMLAPAATIGGLGLLTLALRLRDPHQGGSWGICPSAAVGFWCPGCGGLRAVNDLTRGDVASAASSNLALVVAIPFVVMALAWWARARWLGVRRPLPAAVTLRVGYGVLALLAVFTVARNLPGSWLAP